MMIISSSFTVLSPVNAQEIVKHDVSAATTTATFYTWDYILSPTTKKVIEYFIVKDASGTIKTAFNACDVCYGSHKGYKQVDDKMQCNNCGNKYEISKLGTAGSGGCWPGYIPNTIDGDQIVINESDLEVGEYYFLVVTYSDIQKSKLPEFIVWQDADQMILNMPTTSQRSIRVIGLSGQIQHQMQTDKKQVIIHVSAFKSGYYFVQIEENGKSITEKIFIY